MVNGSCFVAFQKPTPVTDHTSTELMHGRTFEETFVYQNIQLFRDEKIYLGADIPDGQDFEKEYQTIFESVKSSSFKKTDFALDVASSIADWVTPLYIAEGLRWLEEKTGTITTGEIAT